MSVLQEVKAKKIQQDQFKALTEALGGDWTGFYSADEVLSYVRDTESQYRDVETVPALLEKLRIKNAALKG